MYKNCLPEGCDEALSHEAVLPLLGLPLSEPVHLTRTQRQIVSQDFLKTGFYIFSQNCLSGDAQVEVNLE